MMKDKNERFISNANTKDFSIYISKSYDTITMFNPIKDYRIIIIYLNTNTIK